MYHCGARASAYPLAPRSGVARAATTETVQILLPPAFISLYCLSRSRAVHVRVQLGIPWTFVHGQEREQKDRGVDGAGNWEEFLKFLCIF